MQSIGGGSSFNQNVISSQQYGGGGQGLLPKNSAWAHNQRAAPNSIFAASNPFLAPQPTPHQLTSVTKRRKAENQGSGMNDDGDDESEEDEGPGARGGIFSFRGTT